MDSQKDPSARRDALLKILRLGGAGVAVSGLAVWLRARSRRPVEAEILAAKPDFQVPADPLLPELVISQGEDPAALVRNAITGLGGIKRFVSRGDVVVVKPNIAWDRTPEQAATTNPEVVREMVRLCLDAGAKRVVVTDVSCNDARRTFQRSGIAEAARNAGAETLLPEERRFKHINLRGDALGVWPVFEPFLAADKMINLPIAKHHSLTGVTLGMKNWYGILGGPRSQLHQHIAESIVDLADFVRPTLTLIDAYRILVRNGPTGGSLSDVVLKKTVVAGTDPVAVDAYVAKAFWNLEGTALSYLTLAQNRGLGKLKFENLRTCVVHA
ncbi:MAG TPA: DUF362 domain-containing protein [Terriglobia bacterium]|jgi:uncharacterized protein (DUF362 family)|nr:DUF362 domain-containing protein [Terriglobia bacterium]